jgi:hypothetical protein
MAVFGDPAGAAFCVWQPNEFSGAQLVKEPGTWNFGELNTPIRRVPRLSTVRCSAGR